jgi:hypothetical protein
MKIGALLSLFLSLAIALYSQDELTNLEKHWHYRYRLEKYL